MPEPTEDQLQYIVAFYALSSSRDYNGHIPISEIAAYLGLVEITAVEERLEWMHLIQAMDAEMKAWREEQPKS